MRGTFSKRPRSPRRVLRGETPLTPSVPTDLRAAHAEAVAEQYGWPELDNDTTIEEEDWYWWDEHYGFGDGLWLDLDPIDEPFEEPFEEPFDDEPLPDRYNDYYDDYPYDLHDYELRDYYPYRTLGYDPTVLDQEDAMWEQHEATRGATTTLPRAPHHIPPHWDRTHPLYGMHPRRRT